MHIEQLGPMVRSFFKLDRGRAAHKVLKKRVVESSTIDGIHVCQLIAAMLIASIGLNVNSTEAVIGAMLICPLMGSVLAMAFATATIDTKMAKEAVIGLVVQMAVCMTTSTIYFVISPLSNATSELLTNSSATVWDVLIALVGGFAGAMGISRNQEPTTLIAGVAVATALMPPLCSTGYGLALRNVSLAIAALYEFLINVVFIAFGAELVFVALKVPLQSDLDGDGVVTAEEADEAKKKSRMVRRRLIVCSLVFAIPCLSFSYKMVETAMRENGTVFELQDTYDTQKTTLELQAVCKELVSYRIGRMDSYDQNKDLLVERVVATVTTSSDISEERKEQMRKLIQINVSNVDEVVFQVVG